MLYSLFLIYVRNYLIISLQVEWYYFDCSGLKARKFLSAKIANRSKKLQKLIATNLMVFKLFRTHLKFLQ